MLTSCIVRDGGTAQQGNFPGADRFHIVRSGLLKGRSKATPLQGPDRGGALLIAFPH
jgi:hypothetical protein